MKKFTDQFGAQVLLEFGESIFDGDARHVLILCRYENGWILTKHRERGLEFPGGKVEKGETLEEAAEREVFEETGAILNKLVKIGHYEVRDETHFFIKAIFYGEVKELIRKDSFLETDGPVLINDLQLKDRFNREYSFIMKDEVVEKSLEYIHKNIW